MLGPTAYHSGEVLGIRWDFWSLSSHRREGERVCKRLGLGYLQRSRRSTEMDYPCKKEKRELAFSMCIFVPV